MGEWQLGIGDATMLIYGTGQRAGRAAALSRVVEASEAGAVRFLLDGLAVDTLADLRRLVALARVEEAAGGLLAAVEALHLPPPPPDAPEVPEALQAPTEEGGHAWQPKNEA